MNQLCGARAVSSGSPRSTQAALGMMAAGGNAFDAGVTGVLLLSVTDNSGFCFGGEVPIILKAADMTEPLVVCGQGPAPKRATLDFFIRRGGISHTDITAAAVPGQLAACLLVLENWGTKRFEDCLQPTLEYLSESRSEWKHNLARTLERLVEVERSDGLEGVCRAFYGGAIGQELAEWCLGVGGLVDADDLAAFRATIERPIRRAFGGYEVYKCGAWTQGPALLQALAMIECAGIDGIELNSDDYLHLLVEVLKLAFADRDVYYGDPLFVDVPLEALLSDAYARQRARLIDPMHASLEQRPGSPEEIGSVTRASCGDGAPNPDPLDTTMCLTADEAGNVFVSTPSGWGQQTPPGPLGIWLGTRLQSLNTWVGHPNCVAPGKRPRITLTPTLVMKDGAPVLAIATEGGDLQDQTTLQILLGHLVYGLTAQQAVDIPRFATHHLVNSFGQGAIAPGVMSIEAGMAADVLGALRSRGHRVTELPPGRRLGMPGAIGFRGTELSPAAQHEGQAGVA